MELAGLGRLRPWSHAGPGTPRGWDSWYGGIADIRRVPLANMKPPHVARVSTYQASDRALQSDETWDLLDCLRPNSRRRLLTRTSIGHG